VEGKKIITKRQGLVLDFVFRKIRAADAKEVGVGNPAEETCCYPNETMLQPGDLLSTSYQSQAEALCWSASGVFSAFENTGRTAHSGQFTSNLRTHQLARSGLRLPPVGMAQRALSCQFRFMPIETFGSRRF
jgi:hypothetical protein